MVDDTRWADFRTSAFGDPYLVWHDGPDFSDIASRYAADPSATGAMLELGLAEGDPLAARAVGHLAPTGPDRDAWVEQLTTRLPSTWGEMTIGIAMSLFALTGSPRWAVPVTEVLASPTCDWSARLTAAVRLRDFPVSPALVASAGGGVCAANYLVRFHCANTLLSWSSQTAKDISSHDALFADVVADPSPDGWAATSATLQEMALAGGSV